MRSDEFREKGGREEAQSQEIIASFSTNVSPTTGAHGGECRKAKSMGRGKHQKLSNLRIGGFSFSVSGTRFPGIGRPKTVLWLPQKRAIFSEGDFRILPVLSSALVAAAASAAGSLSAMTCRRDWGLFAIALTVLSLPSKELVIPSMPAVRKSASSSRC